MKLTGKKLLIVGGVNQMDDLVTLAHRNGVSVGVTDYNENTYLKQIADAKHNVNAVNVDEVVHLCTQAGYDGVISNFVDMLSPFVTRIADKIGGYAPYTEEQLLMSTNKKYFKEKCLEYGVLVPREYKLERVEDVRNTDIDYPVIVKPVDGSGSKGISICHTADELELAFVKALRASRSGDVIIEDFISDDEINVTYIIQDGDVQCAAIHDRYFNTTQKGVMKVPDLYIYPSKYTDLYMRKFHPSVVRMLEGINLKNGSLFMQACVKNNKVYLYEAGMRLNGCKTYQLLEVENDYNTFEHLMEYALTGSMGVKRDFDPKFKHWYATLNVLGEPGQVIARHEGLDELMSFPWLIAISRKYRDGEMIPDDAAGTLIQDTTRIQIAADTKEQLIERINKVNSLYRLINPEGRDIILTPHNTEDVHAQLTYDL